MSEHYSWSRARLLAARCGQLTEMHVIHQEKRDYNIEDGTTNTNAKDGTPMTGMEGNIRVDAKGV